jgi:biopolymer transport protein TolQ
MNDISFIQIISNASLIVQIVIVILLLTSIVSWSVIFRKSRQLQRIERISREFEDRFRKVKDTRELNNLYNRITSKGDDNLKGLEHIFGRGYDESRRLRKQLNLNPNSFLDSIARSMRIALQREQDILNEGLTVLATVGSVSPYIGLFGTVWGIMNAFHVLGGVQQVTLAMIAPSISEALVATAMGLCAAIPAVMAYNHYSENVDRLLTRYEIFSDEFLEILQRQAIPAPTPTTSTVPALNVAL